MWMWVHASMQEMCMHRNEGQRSTPGITLRRYPPWLLKQGLSLRPRTCQLQYTLWPCAVMSASLLQCWDHKHTASQSTYLQRFWRSNAGLYAFKISTLPTQASPLPITLSWTPTPYLLLLFICSIKCHSRCHRQTWYHIRHPSKSRLT